MLEKCFTSSASWLNLFHFFDLELLIVMFYHPKEVLNILVVYFVLEVPEEESLSCTARKLKDSPVSATVDCLLRQEVL